MVLFGPPGLPAEILNLLNSELLKAQASSDVRDALASIGLASPVPATPEEGNEAHGAQAQGIYPAYQRQSVSSRDGRRGPSRSVRCEGATLPRLRIISDEAHEGTCFGGSRPAGREHRPKTGQFPISQHLLDGTVRELGREHPFRADGNTRVGEDGGAVTRKRPLSVTTTSVPSR
jgi:hypothetical protein